MQDDELLRYSRHILLPEIGIEGQTRIRNSRVLIIGAGGLGSPAALYLAASGVGTLAIADPDTVDLTNLQRQLLHETAAVGKLKVESAVSTLTRTNPDTRVIAIPERLEGDKLAQQVAAADVVLDCCDNFPTRHALNRACVKHRKPLVSGAAIRLAGQLTTFDLRNPHNPCYHCLFPEGDATEDLRCAVTGVFAPLTGIVGAMQAAEALKVLCGFGQSASGRLWVIEAGALGFREIRYSKDMGCTVCAQAH